jgi:hypothetical protein
MVHQPPVVLVVVLLELAAVLAAQGAGLTVTQLEVAAALLAIQVTAAKVDITVALPALVQVVAVEVVIDKANQVVVAAAVLAYWVKALMVRLVMEAVAGAQMEPVLGLLAVMAALTAAAVEVQTVEQVDVAL